MCTVSVCRLKASGITESIQCVQCVSFTILWPHWGWWRAATWPPVSLIILHMFNESTPSNLLSENQCNHQSGILMRSRAEQKSNSTSWWAGCFLPRLHVWALFLSFLHCQHSFNFTIQSAFHVSCLFPLSSPYIRCCLNVSMLSLKAWT